MSMSIIEKSNNGLFENEIELNGKYATIVRRLKEEIGLFSTFREAYITAAIIGYINNKNEIDDDFDKVQPASIFPNELNKRKNDLKFLYRMIMLVKDEANFTIEDYMNRAFRDDADEPNFEKLKRNMVIFHSYVCGGLDYFNEKFGSLDRIDDIINALYEMVHSFAIDVGMLSEEELPEFNPNFE